MKIQVLDDLHWEINRLFIAGSKFARNDPRLTKYVPILDRMGEKAPVFKKLAQDVAELTQTESIESADKLLNLSTLLYSVLYTQGAPYEAVETMTLIPVVDLNEVNTTEYYLKLNPVIEALSTSKQDRMKVLEDGFQQGVFHDFRTFRYINEALGVNNTELADFIERTVIPSLGGKILPLLKSTVSYEGRPEDIRRFRILHASKYPGLEEMIPRILAESSVNMQAEAVHVLGDDIRNEPHILVLADDKHKPVREAAYMALAGYGTPVSIKRLSAIFLKSSKQNLKEIVGALKAIPVFIEDIFNLIRADFEHCVAFDKDGNDEMMQAAFERLHIVLNALYEKTDERILDFLAEILRHKNFNVVVNFRKSILEHTGKMIGPEILKNLKHLGEAGKGTLRRLTGNADVMQTTDKVMMPAYFIACSATYSSTEMYDTFAGYYKLKLIEAIVFLEAYTIPDHPDPHFYWNSDNIRLIDFNKVDKRWCDLFVEQCKNDRTAFYMAVHCDMGNEKIRTILFDRFRQDIKNKRLPADDLVLFIEKLAEASVPDYHEIVMSLFENVRDLSIYTTLYNKLSASPALKQFPRRFGARFRKLYQQSSISLLNEIANLIALNPA